MSDAQMIQEALVGAAVIMCTGVMAVLICCLAVAVVAIRERLLRRKRGRK